MISQISNYNRPLENKKTSLTPEQAELKKACTEFEALMVRQMLETMSGPTDFFGKGFGGDFYQSMFLDEISKKIAEQGLGLSKMLYSQLDKSK
ncbi:MAG: rod-binding protein [Bacteroidota bacterium]